jgi:hypothetical protein
MSKTFCTKKNFLSISFRLRRRDNLHRSRISKVTQFQTRQKDIQPGIFLSGLPDGLFSKQKSKFG